MLFCRTIEASMRLVAMFSSRHLTNHISRTSLRKLHSTSVSSAASQRHDDRISRQRFWRKPKTNSRVDVDNSAASALSVNPFSSSSLYTPSSEGEHVPFVLKPELDFDGILRRRDQFEKSVDARKMSGIDIQTLVSAWLEVCELEEQKSVMERERKSLNAQAKALSKQKVCCQSEKEETQREGRRLREALKSLNSSLNELMNRLYPLALALPNQLHEDVPIGDENRVIDTVGDRPPNSSSNIMKHTGISADHPLVHPGYAYTHGDLVLREMDLLTSVSSRLSTDGFTRLSVPDMYKPIAIEALGIDAEDTTETYAIETSENIMHLAGTSPMGFLAYYMMTVLEVADLPQRSFAVGRSYDRRAESPTFQGLHHQFQDSQVEVFGVCEGSDAASDALLSQYVQTLRAVFSDVGVPFRIVEVSSTKLLPCMHRQQAIEVWIPSQEDYIQVANVCSCTDFISRRLKIRYPSNPRESAAQSRQRNFVHTIHGTALKSAVLLSSILEHEGLPLREAES